LRTTERVTLTPAYVLHQYDWRETSRIVEIFSREYGRLGLVARGSRRKNSPWKALLRPFQPLLLSWMGTGELATLIDAESANVPCAIRGRALMSGFYMNELILRLLPRQDPHPDLFYQYMSALSNLEQSTAPTLRKFEMNLLSALGYGLNIETDAISGQPLEVETKYCYEIEKGLVPVRDNSQTGIGISGRSLLAIASGNYQKSEYLSDARNLLRSIIDHLLGDKPLKTREVMRAFMKAHI
jgi:DNA repair protein RecO (recombination protein O)